MGCWVCIPTCGQCKPASRRGGMCPECNQPYYIETKVLMEGTHVYCESCGADLTEIAKPVPEYCKFTGETCAVPCGKAKRASDLGLQKCGFLTRVS